MCRAGREAASPVGTLLPSNTTAMRVSADHVSKGPAVRRNRARKFATSRLPPICGHGRRCADRRELLELVVRFVVRFSSKRETTFSGSAESHQLIRFSSGQGRREVAILRWDTCGKKPMIAGELWCPSLGQGADFVYPAARFGEPLFLLTFFPFSSFF